MTSFNREKYIAEAIESVLLSTYTNFELYIVDDRSTDNTVAIAKTYEAKDHRIKIFVNEQNLGDYPNRNNAVNFAKGKYIMYCDSDDCFFIDTIEYCVNAMENFPSAGIGLYYAADKSAPFILKEKDAIKKHFFDNPILNIGPGGTIMHRNFFLTIGGYPEKYGPANDMYFNLKVSCETDILFLPKLFLFYRIHEGQEKNNLYSYIYNNYRYLEDAFKELNLGLGEDKIRYLRKKNNRRFAVNLIRHFIRTKDFYSTRNLWQKANFNLQKFFNGIIHFN